MRHSSRLEAKGIPNLSATKGSDTPPLISPPGTKTPPTDPAKRLQAQENQVDAAQEQNVKVLDVEAVSAKLNQHDEARRQRDTTPGESPQRKRARVNYGNHGNYSDRYVIITQKVRSRMSHERSADGALTGTCRIGQVT